jgi:hypothetical protein
VSRPDEQSAARGRAVAAARAGWGCALLLAPRRVAGVGTRGPVPGAAVAVLRVLGARQLLQSAATAPVPTGAVAALGAAVDALHAGTCVGFAAVWPRWRRVALTEAVIATALAAAGWSCVGPDVRRTYG